MKSVNMTFTTLLIYVLTNSWSRGLLENLIVSLAGQDIFRVQKSSRPAPVLRHVNVVHNFQPCFLKIHFNIIFTFTSRSPEWWRPFTLLNQHFYNIIVIIIIYNFYILILYKNKTVLQKANRPVVTIIVLGLCGDLHYLDIVLSRDSACYYSNKCSLDC
jgi:hypothetical protein